MRDRPLEGVTTGGEITDEARAGVLADLRAHFRPEFLNRIDETVLFKPLTLPEIEKIVDLMFDDLRTRLADRDLRLEVTDEARRYIASAGFDPVYGARPLRRFLQREVETRIGRALLGVNHPSQVTASHPALYRARTVRALCELAFCDRRAGSVACLFACCT